MNMRQLLVVPLAAHPVCASPPINLTRSRSMRVAFVSLLGMGLAAPLYADPLPSWNDTDARSAIIAFVGSVTDPLSPDYVTPSERIAVFDNDGTLWAEQPVYFQVLYALDILRERAEANPGILTSDVLRAAAEGDMEGMLAGGQEGLVEILNVSHSGTTVEAFQESAGEWLTTETHPTTGLTYTAMTYQPMLELLHYLRDEGFSTYIVSGGGVDFIRAISEDAYGIPPWQVVGSEGATVYTTESGTPELAKNGGITFVDDKEGKPVGIMRYIGQRPIFAAGNSDGDFAMLEWITSRNGPSFGMLVHHTDGDREFAYDREGHIGALNQGLDEAEARGWLVVDMAADWQRVFGGE